MKDIPRGPDRGSDLQKALRAANPRPMTPPGSLINYVLQATPVDARNYFVPGPDSRSALQKAAALTQAAAKEPSGVRLPTDSEARKSIPIYSGLFDYFPDALADVARLSKAANDKHNPGEPLHWSREKSNDHADCIGRHMIDRGTLDEDGFLHDAKVAWRALAQLQLAIEKARKEGRY